MNAAVPTSHAPPQRLLVVDDEPTLREVLAEYFARHGFAVETAADAAEARTRLLRQAPALMVLDIHMPGEDGLSLARWLRSQPLDLGIVLLTAAGDPVDRVVGLELGADDYVAKPFEPRELLARVRAVLRRLQGAPSTPAPAQDIGRTVPFGDCELRLDQRRLMDREGREVPLSASEFELLALFARSPHRPLNRDRIMEALNSRECDAFDRSIDMRVMRLRRKVERNPNKPELIRTVRNVGYMYVPAPVATHAH